MASKIFSFTVEAMDAVDSSVAGPLKVTVEMMGPQVLEVCVYGSPNDSSHSEIPLVSPPPEIVGVDPYILPVDVDTGKS